MTGARRDERGSAGADTRREAFAVGGLCAAAAATALFAAGRTWVRIRATTPVSGAAPVVTELSGDEVTAVPAALAWVVLAGLAAVAATAGAARIAVGGVLTAAGAGMCAAAVAAGKGSLPDAARRASALAQAAGEVSVQSTSWWLAAAGGGAAVALAGLGVMVRGRRWPAMSGRYERQGGRRSRRSAAADVEAADPTALWHSLDRGVDPTDRPVPGPAAGARTAADDAREVPGQE